MTSHWTSLQTSSPETLPRPGLAISITVPFYDDSFRCHAEASHLVELIMATGGKKTHYYKDPILFLLLSHCRFFCSIYSPWVFYETLNFYSVNIELYQSRLSVTVDGRKSLRITVRDALLSKKAFVAFALIGVTGNETYQIQVYTRQWIAFS